MLFSDEQNNQILLGAVEEDNLPLVKELKRYIDAINPPKYIPNIIYYNSYKVLNWLLTNFSYKPEAISLLLSDRSKDFYDRQSNHADKIISDYLAPVN
jgi:hypothetical protein